MRTSMQINFVTLPEPDGRVVPGQLVFSHLGKEATRVLRLLRVGEIAYSGLDLVLDVGAINTRGVKSIVGFCNRWQILISTRDRAALEGLVLLKEDNGDNEAGEVLTEDTVQSEPSRGGEWQTDWKVLGFLREK